MNDSLARPEKSPFADSERIVVAIQDGIRRVVLRHARLGHPVAESRNGKVVWVRPEEVLADHQTATPP
jgi:hypothetical protein